MRRLAFLPLVLGYGDIVATPTSPAGNFNFTPEAPLPVTSAPTEESSGGGASFGKATGTPYPTSTSKVTATTRHWLVEKKYL